MLWGSSFKTVQLFSITHERKLDYWITDKEAIDADGIIIPFLDKIDGKLHAINFVQSVKNNNNLTTPWQLDGFFSSYNELILEAQ